MPCFIPSANQNESERNYSSFISGNGISLKIICVLLICFFQACVNKSLAQYKTRFSSGFQVGTNYADCSIASYPGLGTNLSFTFVPIRLLTISLECGAGIISGQRMDIIPGKTENIPDYLNSFRSAYIFYGVNHYLNLQHLFYPRRMALKWIPYVFWGMGRFETDAASETNDGRFSREYHANFYTSYGGVMVRIKANKKIDYLLSASYYMTQTYFLDAIPNLGSGYDNFVSLSVGMSYKIKSNPKQDLIDWTRKSICPQFYR